MEKLRSFALSVPITLESWLISFAGIVLLRTFLEQYAYFGPERFALIDLPTIIHYGLFFLASITGTMVILMIFAGVSLKEVSVFGIFGLFLILVSPIVDIVFGGPGSHSITYVLATGEELLSRFVTFFGGATVSGITIGTKVELISAIIFCCIYVYAVKKNIFRALGAGFILYCLVFFLGSLPSFMAMFTAGHAAPDLKIAQSIVSSHIIQNNIHPSFSATDLGFIDLGFNKIMAGATAIIALLATVILFFLAAPKKLRAVLANSRPERIIFLLLLFLFGSSLIFRSWPASWVDMQSYVLAMLALVSAWICCICQNDIHDKTIDVVSNPGRPLAAKDLSADEMRIASLLSLVFAFVFAYASGHYILFFISLFLLVHYIYSNPPLRLKRFVIINSFLGSLVCLSVVLAGFFIISPDKSIAAFPFRLILFLVLFFTIAANFCDIKDINGDRAAGIKTLPVLLGVKRSKKLIAGATSFFFLLTPLFFKLDILWAPSVIAGILAWYFINKESYREWPVFAVYISYLVFIIFVMIFT